MKVTWAKRFALCAAAALWALAPAQGTAAAELRIGLSADITSADPQRDNLRSNNSYARHVFDMLVGRDPYLRPVPGLAVSWSRLDDLTWTFALREGVRFHDGALFTAADVVFSLCRVAKVEGATTPFLGFLKGVASVKAEGPHRIVIRTIATHVRPRS